MPASSFDLYYMQDARNNFDAMRPVPVCIDANQAVGQCQQKIHISTNCYYGYHSSNNEKNNQVNNDCEMPEAPPVTEVHNTFTTRKRSADEGDHPHIKRQREGKTAINKCETSHCDSSRHSVMKYGFISEGMVPPNTTNINPCFRRPTHNNPDISRCLMEVQREREIVPETRENLEQYKNPQDLLESLFWNTHGGDIYHLVQCL